MRSFSEAVYVVRMANAAFFAADLFREAFAANFPVPRENVGLPISTPLNVWHQYVAFYKWSETCIEPVAFVNFLRYGDVYLEGGLCARRNFYRRLPTGHWAECKQRGGIVQVMLETASNDLSDAIAWYGYCGDRKSWLVSRRIGYERTLHPYLIAKWFGHPTTETRERVQREVEAIGPF